MDRAANIRDDTDAFVAHHPRRVRAPVHAVVGMEVRPADGGRGDADDSVGLVDDGWHWKGPHGHLERDAFPDDAAHGCVECHVGRSDMKSVVCTRVEHRIFAGILKAI